MGREVRMVPPNWDHPRDDRQHFQPMYDRTFQDAAAEWKREFFEWEAGKRPDYCDDPESRALEYWEWNGEPPERKYYRPWSDAEATWVQVWETVSEGTPVTPPFATREELIAYLVNHGDRWDQERGDGPWDEKSARAFIGTGWAPTGVFTGGTFYASKDLGTIPTAEDHAEAAWEEQQQRETGSDRCPPRE